MLFTTVPDGGGMAAAAWATTSSALAATNDAEPENSISMPAAVAFLACRGRSLFMGKLLD
jgi:hypothetical protein